MGKGEWAAFSNNSFSIPWNIRIEFIYPDYYLLFLFTFSAEMKFLITKVNAEKNLPDRRKNRTLDFPLKINQRKPANVQCRE